MDTITQFVLGASVAGVGLGPRLGWRAILVGGVIATLPDLDSLIPYDSPLDKMTYHRGFTHSLIVQTALSPLIASGLIAFFKNRSLSWLRCWLTVWLCLITHSLLDSLTTYGTQLFWPFHVGSPVAFSSVFIIDPLYTILLIIGIIGFLSLARKRLSKAVKFCGVLLGLSTLYLGLGMSAHLVVQSRAMALPQLEGTKIHVQPTPFNILYWQVLAINDKQTFVGATSVLRTCPLIDFKTYERFASPFPLQSRIPQDVKRFEWFTDGFYSYRFTDNGILISDLRIGFAPTYPFTFQFARKSEGAYILHRAKRVRQSQRSLAYLQSLYHLAQKVPDGC